MSVSAQVGASEDMTKAPSQDLTPALKPHSTRAPAPRRTLSPTRSENGLNKPLDDL